ncbi:MAG TPA: site-2 protease family protein [Candidatus Micrarchaeia archaeon]|nr:site-2 protease family protein [Candidatus Micrarchaeia archaeon]
MGGTGVAFYLILVVFALPGIVIGFTCHEFCHALVATGFGDPLPRRQGRLSLNPAAQVDPVGLVMLLLLGFGFARPVQFNPLIVRTGPRRAWVAAVGPLCNLALAAVLGLALRLLLTADPQVANCLLPSFALSPAGALYWVLIEAFFINVILCVFNLLPIPPLDGYRVVEGLLGGRFPRPFAAVERRLGAIYLVAILLLVVAPQLLPGVGSPVYGAISALYTGLWHPLVGSSATPLTFFPNFQYLFQAPSGSLAQALTAPCGP